MNRISKTLVAKLFTAFVLITMTACASRDLRRHFVNKGEILRRQWTYSIEPVSSSLVVPGMEYVSPVLSENTLIFGSDRFGVVSLYPKIQAEKWKIKINNGVVSPIEISGGFAYFVAGDGLLYSVATDTGKTQWTYSIRNPVASKPTVSGNDLYVVTSDDALLSLEASTGKWQWHYRRRNTSGPTIHGASRPLVIGDSIWVGFADGALVSLAKKDGKVLWEKTLNSNRRFSNLNAEFVRDGDVVYVPAYDGSLYALSASNGSTIWVRDGLGGSKKVTLKDGVLYAPTSSGELYALDAKTGKDIWKFELDQGISSDVVVIGNHVILSSSSEYIYALDKKTGDLAYRYQIGYGSGFSGGMAYDASHNWIYVLSRGGNLLSFSYQDH
ncbi:MAG: PQQ-binding-like beta-propeller repeat protein [Bdellovibrionales bacterium]|nr:PQQ-binding-like beta-propeller repeat protein [Bdellovibrionales bacterium]